MNIANYRPFSLYVVHHRSRIIGECGEHWRQVADIRFAHPEENNTGNLYSSDGGLNIVAVGAPRHGPRSFPTPRPRRGRRSGCCALAATGPAAAAPTSVMNSHFHAGGFSVAVLVDNDVFFATLGAVL